MSPRPGRLVVLGYPAPRPPPELFAFARRFGLGGVILFARNCPDPDTVGAATREVRERVEEADPGWTPLVLVDQEGGRVERIREGVPSLPPAREIAGRGPLEVARAVREQARALARLGVDVNLAPVCDVLGPGESGAIGDRSFGSDPEEVAGLAVCHLEATLAGGVLPCAKHFPGHGGAAVDSHRVLPELPGPLAEFEARDLVPFRAAVRAGVPLVMAGHLLIPCVSARPASLSPRWLGEILRGRLGFRGAVVSDDLEMGALAEWGSDPEVAAAAVAAGCDLLIYGRMLRPGLDPWAVAEGLGARVPAVRLREAEARVAALGRSLARGGGREGR